MAGWEDILKELGLHHMLKVCMKTVTIILNNMKIFSGEVTISEIVLA